MLKHRTCTLCDMKTFVNHQLESQNISQMNRISPKNFARMFGDCPKQLFASFVHILPIFLKIMSLMRVCVRQSSSIHQGQLVSELMTCRLTGPDTLHDSYATQEWDSMCRMKPNRTSSHRPGCRLNMLRPMSPHHPQSGSPCRQTVVGPAVCYWGILIYSVPLHPV